MHSNIFDAVQRNDLEKVKMLIEKGGVPPTIRHPWDQNTLAHKAVKNGHLDMLKYLLEKEPSLKTINYGNDWILKSDPLLCLAVECGQLDMVKYFVEKLNADIYGIFHGKFTPINWAVYHGHLPITKYFVEERNIDINKPLVNRPLLFDAVEYNRSDIITYLVEERKAHLTVLDEKKENILFVAVRKGNLNFIKYVLDDRKAKIDINWENGDGLTLVYVTVTTRKEDDNLEEILRYLIDEKHANFKAPAGKEKRTLIHHMCIEQSDSSIDIIEYLINRGADIGVQDINGDTALHLAISDSSWGWVIKVCECLCKYGANVNQKNKRGETPLNIALNELAKYPLTHETRKNHTTEKCELLIEHGANLNTTDERGNQIVHIASMQNMLGFLHYLVRVKRVDINTRRETDNWTPLHCAALFDNFGICKYLIEHGADIRAESKCGKTPAQVASNQDLLDYIRNASTTRRGRRSVENYFPALLQNPTYHENTYRRLEGPINTNSIGWSFDSSTFGFQHFLSCIGSLTRYFYNPSRVQRPILVSTVEILESRMDPTAVEAVDYFSNFTDA